MGFRPIRNKKRAISEECAKDLLENEKRGILAMNGEDGYPYAVPINYFYDRDAQKIYFHGAKAGYKSACIDACDKVCFTVYGNEHYEEGDWAPYSQSTVVFGRCSKLETTPESVEKLRKMALKYYPTKEEVEAEIEADVAAAQIYEIAIEYMTGKQIQEK